ncbi:hypothetical protein HY285_05600 [Candidatus Peregrinibacteria bacterium]|nr:hypothetical protein [Candidatus Peregrinibacteria bacterium]MBI3816983.1 hypothetical protein [Candidatus Peregrinibacteria bacterium]
MKKENADCRIALLAHDVRSLWNVGSFFRTSDAFRVERIYLSGYTGCRPTQGISSGIHHLHRRRA